MPPADPTVNQWFTLAYEELRRLARRFHESEANVTLSPTAMVHEAWIRLSSLHNIVPESRAHFLATAARAMRRVLVDAARQRIAEKRGSGSAFVTLDDSVDAGPAVSPPHVLALDDALDELEASDPRASRIVQYRFFGGLTVSETADVLQVSEATVHRDWQFARAWLSRELAKVG
jgi:RNA polymerase sigma factor (TIGR02999 family)